MKEDILKENRQRKNKDKTSDRLQRTTLTHIRDRTQVRFINSKNSCLDFMVLEAVMDRRRSVPVTTRSRSGVA